MRIYRISRICDLRYYGKKVLEKLSKKVILSSLKYKALDLVIYRYLDDHLS